MAAVFFYNPYSEKWEVVTSTMEDGEDPERVLFEHPEDAQCYHRIYQLFAMRKDLKDILQAYIEDNRKSA